MTAYKDKLIVLEAQINILTILQAGSSSTLA